MTTKLFLTMSLITFSHGMYGASASAAAASAAEASTSSAASAKSSSSDSGSNAKDKAAASTTTAAAAASAAAETPSTNSNAIYRSSNNEKITFEEVLVRTFSIQYDKATVRQTLDLFASLGGVNMVPTRAWLDPKGKPYFEIVCSTYKSEAELQEVLKKYNGSNFPALLFPSLGIGV